ncbi:MAG: NgoFVII family restriction endonuclease [Clostridiales bacterium]|jgi:hypothetical protein|nr:NgoFVII family restriction endonuclease [Clostridiales bacterium]
MPFFLSGKKYEKEAAKSFTQGDYEIPDECMIDFDLELIDIFKRQAEQEMSIREKIEEQFDIIRGKVTSEVAGKIPSRVDLFTYMETEIYEALKRNTKYSPFRDYLSFLEERDLLDQDEKALCSSLGKEFITMIETTSMNKSYKMPLLMAFYNNGKLKMIVNEEDIYHSFKKYYSFGSNKVDLLKHKSSSGFESWTKKDYVKLAVSNPVKFISQAHPECFKSVEGYVIGLKLRLKYYRCTKK